MHTNSLVNMVLAQRSTVPQIAMGATICGWTDRTACTIIDVSANGKTVTIQHDTAKRIDNDGISEHQEYQYTRNPSGHVEHFTRRKNGRWVRQGSDMKTGTSLSIGQRNEYYDFSF